MPLSRYKKFCYRLFRDLAENSVSEGLKEDLLKANIDIRPAAYIATAWMNTIISIIVSEIAIVALLFLILPTLGFNIIKLSSPSAIDVLIFLVVIMIPFGIGFLVYFIHLLYPKSRAKYRGKRIDFSLPYALNFISAMSAAGAPPHEIFISLSKQSIYGEVREEAARIAKDMKLLGIDVVTALKKAMERTPSERFKEFLQGAIVTITSGGRLKPYFMAKADQYMRENRQRQKTFLETLTVMAESYVTAAVAGPLLMLIVLPLLMIVQGSFGQIKVLYPIVGIILPLIHFGFAMAIRTMTPEV